MIENLSRRELLRRAAAGGAAVAVPGLLAACGGGGGGAGASSSSGTTSVEHTLAKTLRFSNWPLYVDVNEKTKRHPSLDQFTKRYGVKVNYVEDINDNDSFFGKIEGPLSQGQSVGRDIIVMTDSSGLPARMIQLGWLEKLDKSALPNIKNLVPTLQHPDWDPKRDYSLPWQSGMTGIGYDPNKVGGTLDSVDELLDNPKLKGKVTMLTEFGDTIGLVMAANGDDPSHVTDATFKKAVDRIQKAVDSGQIRQFTGNDYAPLLAKGDVWAAFAWSGDLVQLQADHPGLKWNLPSTGGMIWTDNMLIPKGGNVYTASVYMNYVYDPAVQGLMEAGDPKRNITGIYYIPPVAGAGTFAKKYDPAVASNPLIFPTAKMLDSVKIFDSKALNNQKYLEQWQNLISG
jgi:spermidine/putrescine transport system substrate-binding protein